MSVGAPCARTEFRTAPFHGTHSAFVFLVVSFSACTYLLALDFCREQTNEHSATAQPATEGAHGPASAAGREQAQNNNNPVPHSVADSAKKPQPVPRRPSLLHALDGATPPPNARATLLTRFKPRGRRDALRTQPREARAAQDAHRQLLRAIHVRPARALTQAAGAASGVVDAGRVARRDACPTRGCQPRGLRVALHWLRPGGCGALRGAVSTTSRGRAGRRTTVAGGDL